MAELKLYLLGPPRLELNGEPTHIGRAKALALFAYLAVTGTPHSREALATLLWPEYTPSRARANLRRVLVTLRQALGEDWLDVQPESIGLQPGAGLWLDVKTFQDRLTACRDHDHPPDQACPDCVPLLTEAVALYQDDYFAGFTLPDSLTFDEWLFFQTQELRQALESALKRLTGFHSEQQSYERAISYARRWLALDLLHEPAHRHLMALYARSGQPRAALRQYELCRATLAEELGVSPAPETTALHHRIRSGENLGAPVVAVAHNLPPQLTGFVGRTADLANVANQLCDPACRLLTLAGPGGIGKTRLAMQAAREIVDAVPGRARFSDGVFFVPLASVPAPGAMVPSIAGALNLSFHNETGSREQLIAHLRQKEMLLVLDDFEHLLASPEKEAAKELGGDAPEGEMTAPLVGADLISEVLAKAPGVKMLITSRAALNLQGEWLHLVEGMGYPVVLGAARLDDHPALALFEQSARRVRPGFSLADNVRSCVRICQLVEGMPLAIEIAASWSNILSPARIAREIESGLDILTTSLRDVPERQRSMRAVFDHSWRLLSESERHILRRLAVFRDGFRLAAAEAVAGATPVSLAGLVEKSLLQTNAEDRYQMHKLFHQYVDEKLQNEATEQKCAQDAHSAYYCGWLQARLADLKGPRNRAAIAQIGREIGEARAAWDWAAEQRQVALLDQALEPLCLFYEARGRYEDGAEVSRSAAHCLQDPASGDGARVLARTLTWRAVFEGYLGDHEEAGRLADLSLDLLTGLDSHGRDTQAERAFALRELGRIALYSRGYDRAKPALERSLALYRELGDRWGAASTLYVLGDLNWQRGASEEARQAYTASLAIQKALGDKKGSADSLNGLCAALWAQGKFEEAERAVRQCIAIHQTTGRPFGLPRGFGDLGLTLFARGEFAKAQTAVEEALRIAIDQGALPSVSVYYAHLADMLIHQGSYEEARAHSQAGLELGQETNNPKGVGVSLFALGCLALVKDAYAETERLLTDAVAVYREFGMERGAGWFLAVLGYADRGLCQRSEAKTHLTMTLRWAAETGALVTFLFALPAAALLLADEGQPERAVEVYGLASRHPFVANSRWFDDVAGKHIATIATCLPLEVAAAAEERGRARDLEATVAELLAELGR